MISQYLIDKFIDNYDMSYDNYNHSNYDTFDIYSKSPTDFVNIKTSKSASNNKIFIGSNTLGSLRVKISGSGNKVYIGNECNLNNFVVNIKGRGLIAIIGNNVTATGNCIINVGQNSNPKYSNIIIGDDVMFAKNCSIFTSDNHPIYHLDDFQRLNQPIKDVVIAPHVWLGQDSKITKSVYIGPGSIVGSDSVVTRDVPAFSLVAGVPAKVIKSNVIWARHSGEAALARAKVYKNKFKDHIPDSL